MFGDNNYYSYNGGSGQFSGAGEGQEINGSYQSQGRFDDFDENRVVSHASSHGNGGNQNISLFSAAASFLKNASGQHEDIDEAKLVQNHEKVNNSNVHSDSNDIGNAAALAALKHVMGDGGSSSGGGDVKSKLLGVAMAQAVEMFEQKAGQGNASGDKQEAVNQAAKMALSLLNKGGSSDTIGGANSGGLSGLLGLLK